jgi:tetratricopeptide (TPR) repeat protein
MQFNKNKIKCLICIVIVNAFLLSGTKGATQRGLKSGDKMPEFSAVDIKNNNYYYKHDMGKSLLVMFISTGQQGSTQAASDLNKIVSEIGNNSKGLEITIVVEDSNNTFKQSEEYSLLKNYNIILDSEYKLWGKFGIIATPTVIISDANDTVIWVKAGHNYDFIPIVRAHISQILGLSHEKAEDEVSVKTAVNDTIPARVERLLQLAEILSGKDKIEAAIEEVSKAKELDPNSIEVNLKLAELLCRAKKNQEALDIIAVVQTADIAEKAKVLTLSGWANRQMGRLDIARNFLLDALNIDPQSIRALFELGNVYQAQGQTEKAMKSYHEALAIILKEPIEPRESQIKP